jgi:hypothetical protein
LPSRLAKMEDIVVMVPNPYFNPYLRGSPGLVSLGLFFCLWLGVCSPGHSQSSVPASPVKSPPPNNLVIEAREDLVRQLGKAQQDRTLVEQVRLLLDFLSERPATQVSRPLATMGDAKKPETINWLLPHHSKILTSQPTLYWQGVSGTSGYRVKLFQVVEGQERLVWEAAASQPPLLFPRECPPLEPGRQYAWQVWMTGSREEGPAATAAFQLPSAQELNAVLTEASTLEQKLRTSLSEAQVCLVLSGFYSQKGFHFKALQLLEQARRAFPDDALIKAALPRVKAAMNVPETDQ